MQGHEPKRPYRRVTNDLIASIEKDSSLPTPAEQANNLILWLGDELAGREGEQHSIDGNRDYSRVGGSSARSLQFLSRELQRTGLLQSPRDESGLEFRAWLTLEGWQRYEGLKRGRSDSRRAFMAMEFDDAKLDSIVDNWFKPAALQTGFHLERINERPEAGSIPNRMRLEILRSRFVVADLTHKNLGAYWEAGFAEGLRKPVIYSCEKSIFDKKEVHFDVTQQQHVVWDASKPEEAAKQLKLCIRVTLPDEAILEDSAPQEEK